MEVYKIAVYKDGIHIGYATKTDLLPHPTKHGKLYYSKKLLEKGYYKLYDRLNKATSYNGTSWWDGISIKMVTFDLTEREPATEEKDSECSSEKEYANASLLSRV